MRSNRPSPVQERLSIGSIKLRIIQLAIMIFCNLQETAAKHSNKVTLFINSVLNQTKSPIILSPFDLFDLSAGLGDIWAVDPNNRFNTYWSIFKDYDEVMSKVDRSRLIGGEVLAWGTATNNDNLENILWMRSAVFG